MAARLWLVATCTWLVAVGEMCQFPQDHPIQNPKEADVVVMSNHHVYIFTNKFGNCSGCVRSLTLCYRPHSAGDKLMTIEIRNPGVVSTYPVTVNSSMNCAQNYGLNHADCCVTQILTAPFMVQNNSHYALNTLSNTNPLLLRHKYENVSGTLLDRHETNLPDTLYKPLFYFTIDSSSGSCNGSTNTEKTGGGPTSSSSTTSSPPSTTPSRSTTASTNPEVDVGAQGGAGKGGSSGLGPVAGGIAATLVIIILLIIGAVVGIMCLKKKQRQRKVVVSRSGEERAEFTNVVYEAAGAEKMAVSLSTTPGNSNTYDGKILTLQKHQYECIEDLSSKADAVPAAYTYADTLPLGTQVFPSSYAAMGAEANGGKRPSLHYEVESIYEAPASSETGLYAQFEKIRIATIPRNSIKVTECLGSGQFGTVNRGVWQSPSARMEVAIKTLKSSAEESDRVKFLQEGAIMGQFKHPNVVRLHGIVREERTVLLVIELLAKDDLREHLLALIPGEGEKVDPSLAHTLLSYCRQVASGLLYLSKKGFVHRDIAARNILLSEDHETCKIADFGMSRDLADETYYISSGGKIPVKWTAPEALHYKKYSTASDVWSFGCLMYEIWSLGHKPFEGYTNAQAIKMVDGGYRLAPPPGCPRALYQLMINCWNPATAERPSADSLSQSLARPDPSLLKWEVSDKPAASPQALLLGAPLDSASILYPDLQRAYLPPDVTDNDYKEPS